MPYKPVGIDENSLLPLRARQAIVSDIADKILESGSEIQTSLSASYVLEGSAFADIAKQAGVDPTGVTECASAIQDALDACAALGVRAYAKGTFSTSHRS